MMIINQRVVAKMIAHLSRATTRTKTMTHPNRVTRMSAQCTAPARGRQRQHQQNAIRSKENWKAAAAAAAGAGAGVVVRAAAGVTAKKNPVRRQ